MAVSDGYKAYIIELLEPFATITTRRVFGGTGIYADGFYCAFMHDDRLYFKVDDTNRGDFEAADMGPFRPYGDERAMQYYEVPIAVLEDTDQLKTWLEKAIRVAQKSKRKKKGKP